MADTYGDLAELYIREGRDAEAEPLLVQRLHTLQHSRIHDELEIANTEADLGGVYILLRRPAMARPLLEHAVPIQERYLRNATLQSTKEVYSQRVAFSLGYSALLNDLEGKTSDAALLYRHAISLGEKTLPVDYEATIMRRYAELLAKTGRQAEADKIRSDATALQLQLKK